MIYQSRNLGITQSSSSPTRREKLQGLSARAPEQKELDVFLKENLDSRRIQPSKSPMASPVFFIKKKDSTLHLVQDYHAQRHDCEEQIPIAAHPGAHR